MLNHLLKDNLWYPHKILLTLFLSLFVSIFYCYQFENQHRLVKMLVIPVLSFVIIYYLLEVFAMAMVDKSELEYQVEKCQRLFKDPNVDNKMDVTGDDVENYTGMADGTVSDLDDDIVRMGGNVRNMASNVNEIGDEDETPLEISTQQKLEEDFENMDDDNEQTEEWRNSFN